MMKLIVSRGIQGIGGAIFSANSLALVELYVSQSNAQNILGFLARLVLWQV
jgi:hypothetical protein